MRLKSQIVAVLLMAAGASAVGACPFCVVLKPTLAQRREAAAAVALGEFLKRDGRAAHFRLHEPLKGENRLGGHTELAIEVEVEFKKGELAVLFGESVSKQGELTWSAVAVDERSFVYFAKAPSLRIDAAKRLRYFAPFLEHADPLISGDAYSEFGHASYDEVTAASDALDQAKLRKWLVDPKIPEARKGFYGMALGLAQSANDRRQNEPLLWKLIAEPAPDVRAGFDGMLGGYMLLAGEDGLEAIERQFLSNPKAAVGDVRHAMTAFRFFHDYGPKALRDRLKKGLRHLLPRPEFAAAAIVDLARWQDWDSLDRIVALYGGEKFDAAVKHAILGFLLVCPTEKAAQHLERLRRDDPKTVAEAEKSLGIAPVGSKQ